MKAVLSIYNHAEYLSERKDVLNRWGSKVAEAVADHR